MFLKAEFHFDKLQYVKNSAASDDKSKVAFLYYKDRSVIT